MSNFFFKDCNNVCTPNRNCIFKGIGTCTDLVSTFCCNTHARMFGLVYKRRSYTNGHNRQWSSIVTYVHSITDLNLPLFVNADQKVYTDEIQNYVKSWQEQFNINENQVCEYATKILSLISAPMHSCVIPGWMGDSNSKIIIYDPTQNENSAFPVTALPLLYRMLLCYTIPSITKTKESRVDFQHNITMKKSIGDTGVFHITMDNKDSVLKYTDNANCVATPLVLVGLFDVGETENTEKIFITPTRLN